MSPDLDEWIVYVRISDDREGGGLGVKRQEKDGRALADSLGGGVFTVCVDNDLTANDRSGRYKPRPAYDRMCELLRQRPGRRGVIAWHTDRLHRTPRELEDFIDLAEATGAPVQTVKAGTIDLATASGRMTARMHCAVARHESEHKSERIRRKVVELADAGAIGNGGPRPYGYRRIFHGEGARRKIIRDEIEPDEAAVVRECADRALSGESLRSIVGTLNARGIVTSTGKAWTQQALRMMLYSGRIAGLREHNRVVVGPAVWPAIIPADQHTLLRALLGAKHRPPGARIRTHYLTGHVYCSGCGPRGVRMRVGPQHSTLKYKCPPRQEGGCNGRVIGLTDLVGMIDDYMVGRLSDPQTLRDLVARETVQDNAAAGLLDRIEADERRLQLLRAGLEDGDEDEMPEVLASIRVIRKRVAAAREQLAQVTARPEVTRLDLPDLAKRWKSLHIDQKQMLLRLFVDRIVIGPAVRGRRTFDPSRVDIRPRTVS